MCKLLAIVKELSGGALTSIPSKSLSPCDGCELVDVLGSGVLSHELLGEPVTSAVVYPVLT